MFDYLILFFNDFRSNEFRPAYSRLHELRALLPIDVPFIACSATVTPQIRRDCTKKLDMDGCEFVSYSPDRPNIFYKVARQTSIEEELQLLLSSLKDKRQDTPRAIIYCRTLNSCAELFATFQEYMGKEQYYPDGAAEISDNRLFGMYHASTTQHNKEVVLKSLGHADGVVRVVIATIALGMGVDMRDVNTIIHYGAPRSIDDYFQECGRGGRSGEQCVSTVFWKSTEAPMYNKPADSSQSDIVAVRKYLMNTTVCRRKWLLDYFDQKPTQARSDTCCDVCNT